MSTPFVLVVACGSQKERPDKGSHAKVTSDRDASEGHQGAKDGNMDPGTEGRGLKGGPDAMGEAGGVEGEEGPGASGLEGEDEEEGTSGEEEEEDDVAAEDDEGEEDDEDEEESSEAEASSEEDGEDAAYRGNDKSVSVHKIQEPGSRPGRSTARYSSKPKRGQAATRGVAPRGGRGASKQATRGSGRGPGAHSAVGPGGDPQGSSAAGPSADPKATRGVPRPMPKGQKGAQKPGAGPPVRPSKGPVAKRMDRGKDASRESAPCKQTPARGSLGNERDVCQACGRAGTLLGCHNCPRLFHAKCLNPPLAFLPGEDWLCPACVSPGPLHPLGPSQPVLLCLRAAHAAA